MTSDEHHLPLDPDLDEAEDERHHRAGRSADRGDAAQLSRWPSIHWRSVAAVAIGGFAGGLARYGIGLAWVAPSGTFPWATFTINTSGAFILAALIVLVLDVLPPTTYLRPAIGTGFCGSYTTFSGVAVAADQLAAHGHTDVAAAYLALSVFAGLAAAALGLLVARSFARQPESA